LEKEDKKMKYSGREITFTKKNKRLHIYFPDGSVFLGTSFSLKKFKLKDIKEMFLLAVMPYEYLNNRFLNK
jgi:hypothetical protein